MAVTSFAAVWVWLLAAGGFAALPGGGAPLPLDEHLSAIAPEECLWYASLSGSGPADANSANQTEQLFAEPQMQRFFREIESQVLKAVRRHSGSRREQRVLASELPKLVRAALTRPMAMYVEEVRPAPGGFDAEAALVLHAGDQRGEVERAVDELISLASDGGKPYSTESVAGVQWRRVPTPPEAPAVRLGWKDDYFIIAVGEATPDKLADRFDGSAPAWLTALREEHPIEREASLGYLNATAVMDRIRPLVEAKEPQAWRVVDALGLTSVRELHGVTGYDETACASFAHIVTDGERRGLWGLLPHEPLAEGDLQRIPKSALFAVAYKFNLGEAWDRALDMADAIEPRARDKFEKALWELETHGPAINIRDDVVDSLGNAWFAFLPGSDLMTSWLNAAGGVRVTDADRLRKAVEKIVDEVERNSDRGRRGPAIVKSTVGDHVIYSVQFPGSGAPVSPSWCVGDDWLVVGLLPQAVRSTLERQSEDSLAAAPAVAEALAEGDGVAAIAYQDTPQLVRSAYPWLQIGMQMASSQFRTAGVEIDPMALPSQEVIVKHLRPGVATLAHRSDGFHIESRHSLPGEGNIVAAAPVAAGLLVPAVGSARVAAREAQDQNSLRQILLSLHIFHDVHKAFPTNVYSEDGKALLSWRVRVLPYIEQQALYDQFRLDEPWDSEHNRQLLAHMPSVFKSPSDADPTKTRFLAVSGPGTMFPGNEKLSFKVVTDGLSNTLAVVQVAPEAAVEWTKPADWQFDAEKPKAGLESRRGRFLGGICDGSVHRIDFQIDDEMLEALTTRAGGEAVSGF